MADLATLTGWLTAAETALNTLATGAQTAEVRVDGQIVVYRAANIDTLRSYITDLRGKIARAGGTCEQGAQKRRVMTAIVGDSRFARRRCF